MLKPVSPAPLQGETEFGRGPSFPMVALRCPSIIAYTIFHSPRMINSLRSVDILPCSRLARSSPHTHGSLCPVEPFAKRLPRLITRACILTDFLVPFPETTRGCVSWSLPLPLIHDGDSGARRGSLWSRRDIFVLITVSVFLISRYENTPAGAIWEFRLK